MEINVKEARTKISSLLDRTQKGEEVVIVRRGKRVARLVPIDNINRRLPDLRTFRNSLSVKGGALSKAVIQGRSEDRY
jgi:prevent-host-death family protein